jgi:hypothetical protein
VSSHSTPDLEISRRASLHGQVRQTFRLADRRRAKGAPRRVSSRTVFQLRAR